MQEFFLVVLGFLLAAVPLWFDRKRRLKGHFRAIRVELDLCKERAETFLTDQIQSPLYRMPLRAYEVGAPILLTENVLSEAEHKNLAKFYAQAEDINRGLDYAASALDDPDRLRLEVSRLVLKTTRLVHSSDRETSLYDDAKKLVDHKISIQWWKY